MDSHQSLQVLLAPIFLEGKKASRGPSPETDARPDRSPKLPPERIREVSCQANGIGSETSKMAKRS